MGWVKGTLVAAGILSASAALLAAVPQTPQADSKPQEPAISRRQRIIVRPQIEMFGGSGVRLGVSLQDIDEASAREHKLPAAEGVLVQSVEPGSAAEKAGIKAGDVIVAFDGERVRSARHLQRLVAETPPDRQVKVGVMRDGRKVEATVKTERESADERVQNFRFDDLQQNLDRLRDLPHAFSFEWDDQAPGDVRPLPRTPRAPGSPAPFRNRPFGPRLPLHQWSSGAGRLGVTVQELTPQLSEYFGAKEGVLVASVSEDSAAARAGVKAGDVITTVNGKSVADAESLVRLIGEQPDGQEVSLGIVRDRKAQTLKVKLLAGRGGHPI